MNQNKVKQSYISNNVGAAPCSSSSLSLHSLAHIHQKLTLSLLNHAHMAIQLNTIKMTRLRYITYKISQQAYVNSNTYIRSNTCKEDLWNLYTHTLCLGVDHNATSLCHSSSDMPPTGDLMLNWLAATLSKYSFLIW
jgi:hypothetical protein